MEREKIVMWGYPQLMDGIGTSQRCSTHAGAHIPQRHETFLPHIRMVALSKVSGEGYREKNAAKKCASVRVCPRLPATARTENRQLHTHRRALSKGLVIAQRLKVSHKHTPQATLPPLITSCCLLPPRKKFLRGSFS